jgi:hypothetical protein
MSCMIRFARGCSERLGLPVRVGVAGRLVCRRFASTSRRDANTDSLLDLCVSGDFATVLQRRRPRTPKSPRQAEVSASPSSRRFRLDAALGKESRGRVSRQCWAWKSDSLAEQQSAKSPIVIGYGIHAQMMLARQRRRVE